jgi:hypothetical protein
LLMAAGPQGWTDEGEGEQANDATLAAMSNDESPTERPPSGGRLLRTAEVEPAQP